MPWKRMWHPTQVPLPGKSRGQRSLVGRSPRGCKESDTTERLHFYFSPVGLWVINLTGEMFSGDRQWDSSFRWTVPCWWSRPQGCGCADEPRRLRCVEESCPRHARCASSSSCCQHSSRCLQSWGQRRNGSCCPRQGTDCVPFDSMFTAWYENHTLLNHQEGPAKGGSN